MGNSESGTNQTARHNQLGQSSFEYVLVLMVTVLLAVGLLRTFNSGVRLFTQQFFGNYVHCLLVAGELPGLGSSDGSGCTMPGFSFSAEDQTAEGGSDGQANYGDSTGGDSGNAKGESSSNEKSSERSEATAGTSEGGGTASSSGRFGNRSSGRPSQVPAASSEKDSKKSEGLSSASTDSIGGSSSAREGSSGRVRYVSGSISPNSEETSESAKTAIGSNQEEGAGSRPRFVAASEAIKSKPMGEDDDDWTFGGLIKYILIAAAIIAMLLILGGQALQIKKGMEGK